MMDYIFNLFLHSQCGEKKMQEITHTVQKEYLSTSLFHVLAVRTVFRLFIATICFSSLCHSLPCLPGLYLDLG